MRGGTLISWKGGPAIQEQKSQNTLVDAELAVQFLNPRPQLK